MRRRGRRQWCLTLWWEAQSWDLLALCGIENGIFQSDNTNLDIKISVRFFRFFRCKGIVKSCKELFSEQLASGIWHALSQTLNFWKSPILTVKCVYHSCFRTLQLVRCIIFYYLSTAFIRRTGWWQRNSSDFFLRNHRETTSCQAVTLKLKITGIL